MSRGVWKASSLFPARVMSALTRGRWQLWGGARPRKVCTWHFSQSSVTLSTSHMSLVRNQHFCSFGLQLRLHRKPTGWAQLWPSCLQREAAMRNDATHTLLPSQHITHCCEQIAKLSFRAFRCLLCLQAYLAPTPPSIGNTFIFPRPCQCLDRYRALADHGMFIFSARYDTDLSTWLKKYPFNWSPNS